MPGSQADYDALVAERMKRYGGDRDKAVRSANIASGYGSSTALRKGVGGGWKQAAPAKSGGKKAAKKSPYKITSSGKSAPKTQLSPDLAPSPNPNDPNSPVGPGAYHMSPGPSGRGPIFEPGGGAAPNLGLPPFKPGLGNLYIPPQELADAQPPVPANPAMSQASILQQPPPALQPPNRQLPAMTQPFVKPEALGGGISSIFFDPNRPRRW